MYLEGYPLPIQRRPQLAKISQDRVTLVVEGHIGEFPDSLLKSMHYTPLLFCIELCKSPLNLCRTDSPVLETGAALWYLCR